MANDYFTPYRTITAEGARIGLVSCLICGVTVTLDPDDETRADQQHLQWHRERGDLDERKGMAREPQILVCYPHQERCPHCNGTCVEPAAQPVPDSEEPNDD
jgi:hypothetical protein